LKNILDDYLKTTIEENYQYEDLAEGNMYLAEDRILCLKIYSRYGKKYTLKYIPSAKSCVDPVTNIIGFLGQRRRWINGSWFALEHVLKVSGKEV
jgi:chitin synthase